MRATARQISFADWELMRQRDQGICLEPLLEAISGFLDDQRDVIERVRRDLVRGLKQPDSGRHGLTATQVLRSLVLMRLKNWDYRELRERIADGLTLRQFTDFYCAPVPKHDAFQRGFIRLTPQTLKAVNDLVVRAADLIALQSGPSSPHLRRCSLHRASPTDQEVRPTSFGLGSPCERLPATLCIRKRVSWLHLRTGCSGPSLFQQQPCQSQDDTPLLDRTRARTACPLECPRRLVEFATSELSNRA
ncbi:hypothetical protein [Bradyrhizobium sp. sBnM-33]|uniref:hypothetical protein n=1 Tax=Bradyrhizobium sp. sBnM-33 TaxID=2831780 RepID=UPI00293F2DD6|nr:hypothetical protein [Bradyrhizobium sp. sBnM-33]WOH52527.1 hypothetical protein RX328_10410 [Bradyrhizobium sp. sBnM-33]